MDRPKEDAFKLVDNMAYNWYQWEEEQPTQAPDEVIALWAEMEMLKKQKQI